jgi:hypothetical protein
MIATDFVDVTAINTEGMAESLQSQDHRDLLDVVDSLRSEGISRYIDYLRSSCMETSPQARALQWRQSRVWHFRPKTTYVHVRYRGHSAA